MGEYTYLVGVTVLGVIWLCMWLVLPNHRREMAHVGVLMTVLGLPFAPLLLRQWWQPMTLTGTPIGIEDVLFLFFWGSIGAGADDLVLSGRQDRSSDVGTAVTVVGTMLVVFAGAMFAGLHMWKAWTVATLVSAAVLWRRRPFLKRSLVSGTVLVCVGVIWFLVLHAYDPGYLYDWYHMDKLTGLIVLHGPIEDYIWAFTSGLVLGPLHLLLPEDLSIR